MINEFILVDIFLLFVISDICCGFVRISLVIFILALKLNLKKATQMMRKL